MSGYLVEYQVQSGSILVEVDSPPMTGDDRIPASRAGDGIIKATESFQEALSPIKGIAQDVVKNIRELGDPPDEVVVGFGIKLTGSTNLVLATGSAEANLEVTLTWKSSNKTQT